MNKMKAVIYDEKGKVVGEQKADFFLLAAYNLGDTGAQVFHTGRVDEHQLLMIAVSTECSVEQELRRQETTPGLTEMSATDMRLRMKQQYEFAANKPKTVMN